MRRHTEQGDPQGGNTTEQPGRRSLRGALEFGKQIGRETLRIYASTPRVVALVWRASPLRVVALAILTVLQGLLPTATVWVGKLVVDGVVAAIAVNVGATTAAATTGAVNITVPPALVGLVGLQFLLAVTGTVLGHVTSIIQQRLSDVVGHRLSVQVLAHANTLDLAHFETPEFYDRLRNAQRLGSQPVQLVTGGLLQVVRNAIVITSMAALLWQFHPLLPMVILVASLPHLVAQMYYSRYGWRLMHRQAPLHRRQSYFGNVMTDNAQAKEIRLFGLGNHLLGRYVEAALLAMRQNWDFRARQRRTATLLSLLSTAVASGAYLYIVAQTVAGRITLGDLTLYSAAVNQTQSTLLGLLGSVTSVYETNLQVDDLFTFLDYRPRIRSGAGRARVPVPLQQGVEFRNVSFSYPPSTPNGQAGNGREAMPFAAMPFGRWMGQAPAVPSWSGRGGIEGNGAARRGWARDVLTDISFTIPAGKTVALVGANGAGKTTIVKLLCRLYDPTAGQVLLDGVDLREYDLEDLRRQIGVVFQDYARYQLTAQDNIGFGQVEHVADSERVRQAAVLGGAEPVLSRLPDGLNSVLGRLFSGGTELSGGEWQKVALARGFMREAPQLLILDEPTASLDAQAEYEVYERFRDLTQGRTTVLISHRFSTVKLADLIVVLEGGCVVEQGSHRELVAAGGTYARLYSMQADRYR